MTASPLQLGMAQAPQAPLGPPGQPPFGSSPTTMPLPQKGIEAAGLAKLGVVVKQLEQLLPVFGMGSEVGQAVHSALKGLAKHVPMGMVSHGLEQTIMQRLMEAAKQQGPQVAAMRGGNAPPVGAGPMVPPVLPGSGG